MAAAARLEDHLVEAIIKSKVAKKPRSDVHLGLEDGLVRHTPLEELPELLALPP